MSAPAVQYEINSCTEKINAFWGCRDCEAGGKGNDANMVAAKHRRQTGHGVWWEFHQKGNYPPVKVGNAFKVVKESKGPAVKLPLNLSKKVDRVAAETTVRNTDAPDGLTAQQLQVLLGITWQQANGLRAFWLQEKTFTVERRGGNWRVFP